MTQSQRQWKGKTGGGNWGQKALLFLFRFLDVRIGYFFVALTIPFYMLAGRKSYLAIFHFYTRRLHYPSVKAFFNVFSNYFRFGQVILDRFSVLARGKSNFTVSIEGKDTFERRIYDRNGFVVVSSHVGNFELSGYLFPQNLKKIYSLVYGGETAVIQSARQSQFGMNNVEAVPVSDDMSHLFIMNTAIRKGEIVCMPADRILGSQKFIATEFLGKEARFPLGPFIFAAVEDIPLVSFFVIKISSKKYKLYIREIGCDDIYENPRLKADGLLRNFVGVLENMVKKYPAQWFNFYEFWNH